MLMSIILSIIYTSIFAGLVALIFYLYLNFNNQENSVNDEVFENNKKNDSIVTNLLSGNEIPVHVIETSDGNNISIINNEEVIEKVKTTGLNQQVLIQNQVYKDFEQLYEENIDDILEDRKDSVASDLNIDKSDEINESFKDLLDLDESQSLNHFNKSRPKKSKTRPSVKVIFSNDCKPNSEVLSLSQDPIKHYANDLVEILFDSNNDSYIENDVQNDDKSESKFNDDNDDKIENISYIENSFDSKDESFEELSTGEYKKFDEFSDYFSLETKRRNFLQSLEKNPDKDSIDEKEDQNETKTTEISSNDEIVDQLFSTFINENQEEIEVLKTNSSSSHFESFEVKKEDNIEITRKSYRTEKVKNFKLSLNKVLSTSEMSISSLKSPLSVTLDSVTKPLLSSPTLSRKSLSSLEIDDSDDKDRPDFDQKVKKFSLPAFGVSQSLIMNEMKRKQFRKSLKRHSPDSETGPDICDQKDSKVLLSSDL